MSGQVLSQSWISCILQLHVPYGTARANYQCSMAPCSPHLALTAVVLARDDGCTAQDGCLYERVMINLIELN